LFKFYTTYDIISEINLQILRSEYSLQLLLDHNDLFFLSKNLLQISNNNLAIEIIMTSNNDMKSLQFVNLCKRLIDAGVSIYWYKNAVFFNEEEFFGVFDKTYVIAKMSAEKTTDNPEEFVRFKNSFFKNILLKSKKIELLSGNIKVDFNTNRTITQKNEKVVLSWNIENAYHASIQPNIGDVSSSGSKIVQISKDQSYVLTATNKESIISKTVYIKVLDTKEIEFDISVFDPILNIPIKIYSSTLNDGHYGVYLGQSVKVSWDINMMGKLSEDSIGSLPLSGFHEFEILKNTTFVFTLNTLENTQKKTIVFHTFEDAEIYDRLNIKTHEKSNLIKEKTPKGLKIKSKIRSAIGLIFNNFQMR
jgi:hypothetical protein|tara:strand:- start:17550 stop:18638 length:1089 start_codon:yes stop_codon:yes gene_type:complete